MIHFREAGAGPVVVLLHGLFGSLENLGGVARVLAESFHVYSLDLPNHGRSAHRAQAPLGVMAAEVQRWMTAQGIGTASLVGHSLGGKVAMELALAHPGPIKKLAVLDIAPVGYNPHHNRVFAGLNGIDLAQLENRQQADRQLGEHVEEQAVRGFLLKNLMRSGSAFSWRMNLAALSRDYPELIAANRSGRFEKPCLFVKGGQSNYIQPAHEDEIRSRFPRAQLKVVPETGHWLHAEKPALVAGLLKRFLEPSSHKTVGPV